MMHTDTNKFVKNSDMVLDMVDNINKGYKISSFFFTDTQEKKVVSSEKSDNL